MVSTRTPLATGITAARIWPASFTSADRSSRSSATADRDDHGGPDQDAPGLLVLREERQPGGDHAAEDREPAQARRRELVQSPRSRGSSIAPIRQASDFTTGVEIQTTTSARANARKASVRSGMSKRLL